MISLKMLVAQMLTASAMILTYMAHTYASVGYGLNPYVALPTATLLMVLPYALNSWINEDSDEISIQTRN